MAGILGFFGVFIAILMSPIDFGAKFLLVIIIGCIFFNREKIGNFFKKMEEERKRKEEEILKAEEERRKAEEEAISKAKQGYASEFKRRATATIARCESNRDSAKKIISKLESKSAEMQKEAWNTLDNISLHIQMLENTIKELNAKRAK